MAPADDGDALVIEDEIENPSSPPVVPDPAEHVVESEEPDKSSAVPKAQSPDAKGDILYNYYRLFYLLLYLLELDLTLL